MRIATILGLNSRQLGQMAQEEVDTDKTSDSMG